MNNKINTEYEILTPTGFEDFDGVAKYPEQIGVTLHFNNGKTFNCAKKHKLILTNNEEIEAQNSLGKSLSLDIWVVNIVENTEPEEYYDILEVRGHLFFSSDIVSHNCEFLGSVATLVDAKFMKDIPNQDPIRLLDKNRLRIYELPIPHNELKEKNYEYLVTVDPAMGTKQDYTVAQVWKIESNTCIKQVAVYESNDVTPKAFIEKAYSLAKIYYDAGLIVETMEQAGGVIVSGLHYDKNYPNLIHMNEKGLGFNFSHDRKIEACVFLQVYMEKGLLNIVDARTIMEISTFGKKGNTYKALGDAHDDLVMATLSMLYYVNSPYFYGNIDEEPIYKKRSIASEFEGFEDNGDPTIKELFDRLHQEPVEEEFHMPMMFNPSNRYSPSVNQFNPSKSPYENYMVYSYEEDYGN